jgi:hypothetical protein
VWGVYTYRPPQKGVGPPAVRLLGARKEIPLTIKHTARLLGVERPMNTGAKRLAQD